MIFILQSSFIDASSAKYGPIKEIPGSQYQGEYSPGEGMVQFKFNNNMDLNISANTNISLDIDLDPSLNRHSFGFNISTMENTQILLRANKGFPKDPKGNSRYWEKRPNNPGQEYGPMDSTQKNIKKNPVNLKTSISLFTSINYATQANNQQSDANEDYQIEVYKDIDFILSGNQDISSLTFFYELTQGAPTNSLSFAYYEEASESWYLLNSPIENNLISTNLGEQDNQEILNSEEINIALVSFQPGTTPIFENEIIKWTLIGIGILVGLIGLLMTKQEYRSYLLNRVMHINKGVHKNLEMEDVLENQNRNEIIDYILENPGIHFNKLQEEVEISGGTLAWHLDVLETFKVIRKMRVGQYLTYFPYLEKNPISKLNLKLRKSKTTLQILQLINDNPGIYQSKIARRLDISHKTVKYHLDKLMDAGIIESDDKRFKRGYYPNPEMYEEEIFETA